MKADDATMRAVQRLENAIQESVDADERVKMAVEDLELMGYVPNFTVKMVLELSRPMVEGLTDTRVRIAS